MTSALYNRKEPKRVLEKAIPAICSTLGVEAPPKKGKGPAKDRRKEKEEQPAEQPADIGLVSEEKLKSEKKAKWPVKETPPEDIADEDAEEAIAKYEALLGGSSEEEDSGSEGDDEEDPMQITSDEGEEDDGFGDIELDSEEGEDNSDDQSSFGGFSSDEQEPVQDNGVAQLKVRESVEDDDSEEDEDDDDDDNDDDDDSDSDHSSAISRSPSPKRTKRKRATEDTGPTTGSTFLPSLMGGYISGSESASDLDIAPPRKNRRGQRARQAIWEKKFKAEAKHLQKPARDQGWDPKRGAVEGARTPWKKGIANPFSKTAGNGGQEASAPAPPKPRKTDNTGPLHPSWEAKKKAEEKEQNVKFQGTKIKFD